MREHASRGGGNSSRDLALPGATGQPRETCSGPGPAISAIACCVRASAKRTATSPHGTLTGF